MRIVTLHTPRTDFINEDFVRTCEDVLIFPWGAFTGRPLLYLSFTASKNPQTTQHTTQHNTAPPFDDTDVAQHLFRHWILAYQPINVVTRPIFRALSISVWRVPIGWVCSDVSAVISTWSFCSRHRHIMMKPTAGSLTSYQSGHTALSLVSIWYERADTGEFHGGMKVFGDLDIHRRDVPLKEFKFNMAP